MEDRMLINRLLLSVRTMISTAEREHTQLQKLNSDYQMQLTELNSCRRRLLFSANDKDAIVNLVTLVNELEIKRNRLDSVKNQLSTRPSAALSYIIMIIECTQDLRLSLTPRLRNELRSITRIVEESRGMNVDYSALVSLAIRGSVWLTAKDSGTMTDMTKRLFIALKNAVV